MKDKEEKNNIPQSEQLNLYTGLSSSFLSFQQVGCKSMLCHRTKLSQSLMFMFIFVWVLTAEQPVHRVGQRSVL